jgi:hypothetical protein
VQGHQGWGGHVVGGFLLKSNSKDCMQPGKLASREGQLHVGFQALLPAIVQASAGLKQTMAAVEQAMGQLRTAVVALELRPPLESSLHGTQDTLQVLLGENLRAPFPPVLYYAFLGGWADAAVCVNCTGGVGQDQIESHWDTKRVCCFCSGWRGRGKR